MSLKVDVVQRIEQTIGQPLGLRPHEPIFSIWFTDGESSLLTVDIHVFVLTKTPPSEPVGVQRAQRGPEEGHDVRVVHHPKCGSAG